jgi:putative tryptophan/tyrosine transport system substrate-binding protein
MKPVLVGVVSQIDDIAAAGAEVDAWYLPDTPFNRVHGKRIRELIVASGKPSIGGTPLRSPDAHLLAYVRESNAPSWARLADIVGLVLSGVRAGDIPFDAPRRFRLMVSLSTARRLGIEVPRSILMRANEVLP